jgi:hypothetical protein
MTPEETQELQKCLEKVSAILLKNTPSEQLKDFGSIELAVRDHLLKEVAPEIGKFLALHIYGMIQEGRGTVLCFR